MQAKIPTTVMASLVINGFTSLSSETLVEETLTPNDIITAGKDKYVDDSCALAKNTIIDSSDDINQFDTLVFNDNSDLVFKPQLIDADDKANGEAAAVRNEIIYYLVQNGDTISTIARRFGLTVNTLLWANNLTSFSLLHLGDRLTILPYSGVLYTVKKGDTLAKIALTYDVDLEKILSCNALGNSLSIGQKIVIPGAKNISQYVAASKPATPSYTGVSIIKDLIKNPSVKISGSKMTWPTVGTRISQYFSWRHVGVDIANKIGTPIYAADSGTVVIAQGGYNGGYGNTIVIDHGGGIKTRYGHASKLFVKVGEKVEKGENIAAMGSTGNSTGPHLHFEVLVNGAKKNPLDFVR